VISIAADFPSVKKPRFIVQERKADNAIEGDADWLNSTLKKGAIYDTC
jgi:hypothetical protein